MEFLIGLLLILLVLHIYLQIKKPLVCKEIPDNLNYTNKLVTIQVVVTNGATYYIEKFFYIYNYMKYDKTVNYILLHKELYIDELNLLIDELKKDNIDKSEIRDIYIKISDL